MNIFVILLVCILLYFVKPLYNVKNDFPTINEQQKILIGTYCRKLIAKSQNKKFIFIPYIAVNSNKVYIFKVVFLANEDTYHFVFEKCIDIPTEKCRFVFEDGSFVPFVPNGMKKNYRVEMNSNQLKIKHEANNIPSHVTISLNHNYLWLDEWSLNVCRHIPHANNKPFPLPITRIVNKANITSLLHNDDLFAREKQFAGYGTMGSKYNSNEYGVCVDGRLTIRKCPVQTVYAGNGQCAILDDIQKTCLEFPQATLRHPTNTTQYFKCITTFPFYAEKYCPATKVYDTKLMRCSEANLCAHMSNSKLAIPTMLLSNYPQESFIECVNGQSVIRKCTDKFVHGKLAATRDGCCDIECMDAFDKSTIIQLTNDDKNSFIHQYPGAVRICKGGILQPTTNTRPIIRMVKEAVFKKQQKVITIDNTFHMNVHDAVIEYDLPTFIYIVDSDNTIVKKYLTTFRDAPQLFTVEKFPVKTLSTNGDTIDNKKHTAVNVYITDNLNTALDDDLICREEFSIS